MRQAQRSDLGAIRTCAELAYEKYIEPIGRRPAPMDADFETQIQNGLVEIIERDGVWAGYCVSEIREDALFIENIALLPAHHGNGLARIMFEKLSERAHEFGLKLLSLYTNAAMAENLLIYPALGFVETERRSENGFERVYFAKYIQSERDQ